MRIRPSDCTSKPEMTGRFEDEKTMFRSSSIPSSWFLEIANSGVNPLADEAIDAYHPPPPRASGLINY